MKNRNTYRLVSLLIFSTILLWPLFPGCKKESPPIEEKELEPKVELSVTPEGVVPYGGNIDVRWSADQNTNKVVVKVNGVIKATSSGSASRVGAMSLGPLFKDIIVEVIVTNVDLSTQVEKEICVGDWTTSAFGLVSYYPWRYKALRLTSLDGKLIDYWIPDRGVLSWVYYYHKDGKLTFSSNLSGNTEAWLIKDDGIILMNGVAHKLQVDQYEMIISYQTTYNSETVWFDMVFEHASDTPTDPD